jgi:hypothetical protein
MIEDACRPDAAARPARKTSRLDDEGVRLAVWSKIRPRGLRGGSHFPDNSPEAHRDNVD